jgi:hypothetical protein
VSLWLWIRSSWRRLRHHHTLSPSKVFIEVSFSQRTKKCMHMQNTLQLYVFFTYALECLQSIFSHTRATPATRKSIDFEPTVTSLKKLCLDWRTAPVEKQESGLDPYQNNSTLLYSGSYSKNK